MEDDVIGEGGCRCMVPSVTELHDEEVIGGVLDSVEENELGGAMEFVIVDESFRNFSVSRRSESHAPIALELPSCITSHTGKTETAPQSEPSQGIISSFKS